MEWIRIANEAWDLLKPLLGAAVGTAIVFLALKQAQWAAARRKLEVREQLNDATKDAVARVDHEYVQPLKNPSTPTTFDADAQKEARARVATIVQQTAPLAVRDLAADGVPVADVIAAKTERAVNELRAGQALPLEPPVPHATPVPGASPR